MVQTLNQFEISNERGRLTNKQSTPYVTNHQIDPAYAGAAKTSGDAFKYSGSGNFVTPATANTDAIIGFANYNVKKNSFVANDIIELAHITCEMKMVAGAAIAAGAFLEFDPATGKVITQATGTTIGSAREAAAADGDLITVAITTIPQLVIIQ